MKEDTGSRTERDAERFEAKRAWLEQVRNDHPGIEDQYSPWDDYEPEEHDDE